MTPIVQRIVNAVTVLSLAFIILLFLACSGMTYFLQIPYYLAVGWVGYLARISEKISLNREAIVTSIACLAIFVAGAHYFLSWLYQEYKKSDATAQSAAWKFRWTAAMAGTVVLAFMAGTAFIGFSHQTLWLLRSPEPIVVNRSAYIRANHRAIYAIDPDFLQKAYSEKWTAAAVRKAIRSASVDHLEHLHILVVEDDTGRFKAMTVFPRDKALLRDQGILTLEADEKGALDTKTSKETSIEKVLAKLASSAPTKP